MYNLTNIEVGMYNIHIRPLCIDIEHKEAKYIISFIIIYSTILYTSVIQTNTFNSRYNI